MQNKIWYLSTCTTCKRIMDELKLGDDFQKQDIKAEAMTEEQIDLLISKAGSAEALFSRRAMKFRQRGLHEQELSEADYRSLILEEYTFLKRPVLLINGEIFIGNSKKVVAAAASLLNNN